MNDYLEWLERRQHSGMPDAITPNELNSNLYPFQESLVRWALGKSRAAIFADCGLGKTLMQLSWADAVRRHTGKRVLVLAPIAVAQQTVKEADKFDIDCSRSLLGELKSPIVASNYERLHHFNPDDFAGVVCDESSILKNFEGASRREITKFMLKVRYRLLCTATAAPNDFIELGTSAEALGVMGHIDMLSRYFKNDRNTIKGQREGFYYTGSKWWFKGHAEEPFWKWVCSWARAIRKPSDIGFPDDGFDLPELVESSHVVKSKREDTLFPLPAVGLKEIRQEIRKTLPERCEKAASLIGDGPAILWANLNDEGDRLESLVPDAVQVSGKDSDETKERKLEDFTKGNIRVLVTKPRIGGFGLNWQHCSTVSMFPTYSYEQYYQCVRRCWRYGQVNPVNVHLVASESSLPMLSRMKGKQEDAEKMFGSLVRNMNHESNRNNTAERYTTQTEVPAWL